MTSKLNFHHNFLTSQINEPKSVQNKADINPAQTRHSKIQYWQGEKTCRI